MTIPNYHDISLAVELMLGARVKVAYKTVVIRTREGDEERIGEWQDALRTFDVTPALRDQTDLDYLIAFFRSRLGPTFAFKVTDPTDYLADHEVCGTGNGIQTIFPLTKVYQSTIRPITLPDLPIVVYINGVVVDAGLYTVDATAGFIQFFTPPAPGSVIRWSGTFQVPVRFQTTQMYTSYVMYQRFEAQIVLQEIRVPIHANILAEARPPDFVNLLFPATFAERSTSGPQYDAIIVTGQSGSEQRIGQFAFPKIAFQVDQALQSTAAMATLLAFFHARRGRLVSFVTIDYTDFQAVNHVFISTDGIRTTYQLGKLYITGDFYQLRDISHPQLPVAIYVNNVLVTPVRVVESEQGIDVVSDPTVHIDPMALATVDASGLVSFATPPPLGAVLSWTGNFYVAVRFDIDELDISVDGPDVQTWSQITLLEVPTAMVPVSIGLVT